jgi:hypothetical protein
VQTNGSGQMVVNVPWENTTYESKTAASWWTAVSLVTTGEKYTWNNKQAALVNQTNIKSVNWNSLLGSWNLSLYSTITVTLTSAGWSSSTQTVTATGVTASNTVIVSPSPANIEDYATCKVYCSAQWSNSLTFSCTDTPTGDISVNVVIMN